MNETLDSQLSAMFDDELPAAECELLARRLSRDEGLQSRWRHYAVIGAAVRGEGGLALNVDLAAKVRKAVAAEAELSEASASLPMRENRFAKRAWQGVAGLAVAAGVAAVSVMWLRAQAPTEPAVLSAQVQQVQQEQLVAPSSGDPDLYVVPATNEQANPIATSEMPYMVAHAEYSMPLMRRNFISSMVSSDTGTSAVPDESDKASEPAADADVNDAQKRK